ncbi:hypothetical protein F4861DRAFT_251577 [Xylaria intraflava]|nr:hypothetical protein F4861DRAFT_251577 [Xylaria intraflava]
MFTNSDTLHPVAATIRSHAWLPFLAWVFFSLHACFHWRNITSIPSPLTLYCKETRALFLLQNTAGRQRIRFQGSNSNLTLQTGLQVTTPHHTKARGVVRWTPVKKCYGMVDTPSDMVWCGVDVLTCNFGIHSARPYSGPIL